MENCIFCKIVKGEIPSTKIFEDENHIAILDKFPNTEGMTLVLTKEHFNSNATKMPEEKFTQLMLTSKKVAKLLEEKLNVERIAYVVEGLGVDHVHVKLYPINESNKKEGHITTRLGPEKSIKELQEVAKKIKCQI